MEPDFISLQLLGLLYIVTDLPLIIAVYYEIV